jgi:hypothetical protein
VAKQNVGKCESPDSTPETRHPGLRYTFPVLDAIVISMPPFLCDKTKLRPVLEKFSLQRAT